VTCSRDVTMHACHGCSGVWTVFFMSSTSLALIASLCHAMMRFFESHQNVRVFLKGLFRLIAFPLRLRVWFMPFCGYPSHKCCSSNASHKQTTRVKPSVYFFLRAISCRSWHHQSLRLVRPLPVHLLPSSANCVLQPLPATSANS
jgi:hypothetical protein